MDWRSSDKSSRRIDVIAASVGTAFLRGGMHEIILSFAPIRVRKRGQLRPRDIGFPICLLSEGVSDFRS